MKNTLVILFFLILLPYTAPAQNPEVDSLQFLMKQNPEDSARIGLYVQMVYYADDTSSVLFSDSAIALIKILFPKVNKKYKIELSRYWSNALYFRSMYFANSELYDTALYYLDKAMEHSLLAKDRLQEARVLNDMGVCFFRKNDVAKCIDYVTKSLNIREQLHDDEQLRNAYNNVAFIYKETGLIDRSLELNFKSLALAEKRKNAAEIALSFNNIGALYHNYLRDDHKAMEYYQKSLEISEKQGDKKAMGLVENNMGALSSENGQYKEAIRRYNESLQLRREVNFKYGIINTLSSLGYNYTKTGDYVNARKVLAEAMQMNEKLQDNSVQTSIHRNYAALYSTLNNPDSALFHAKLSHSIDLKMGNPLRISGSARVLADLYEKTGNFSEALNFYKLHKKMQDSISNDDLKKAGIKSSIEYEYFKKKVASDQVHSDQLAKKNLYTWLILILFVAAVLIGYGLYKRYRLKQQLKEVEIRNKIASDLHDDVGSTLSSIRMYSDIVKHQPNQTQISIELLGKISSNSKETIENMSDIVWMIKPGNDDFANIEDRMLNFGNELCTPKGINFEMNKNELLSTVKIPMEQRRDIYLIFKEAVNNAVKYADCHFIRSSIYTDKSLLKMVISDDGNGFDIAPNDKKGNGLANMQKRAAAHKGSCTIQSKEGEGTEIEVVFSL